MSHGAPWCLWICAESRIAILSNVESWRCFGDCDVDHRGLVGQGFDCVSVAILREFHGEVVGVEAVFVVAEINIRELIRGPEIGLVGALWVVNLAVELGCCPQTASYAVSMQMCWGRLVDAYATLL